MRAWVVERPGPIGTGPLRRVQRDVPQPGPGQVRVRVSCCGVCRTDLQLAEGDLPPRRPQVAPGHEVVGHVDAIGAGSTRFRIGDRIGVPWLGGTDGSCRFCRRGAENLCVAPTFTGWDVDGGYADTCVVDEAFALPLPASVTDEQAAPPVVCRHHRLSRPAGRGRPTRWPARDLRLRGQRAPDGATRAARRHARPRAHPGRAQPSACCSARRGLRRCRGRRSARTAGRGDLVRPAGELVPVALRALDRGGTLAVAGIWLSDIPQLDYDRDLFQERRLRSVTANTRADAEEFLLLADRFGLRATTTAYSMDEVDRALRDLAAGAFSGAAVLRN